jgi:glycosyltransferase involved in cell wall biosynthesis
MDLLVLPSYREGFPTVILEAGAMGVPVIATDIVGNRDAVAHGKTGLLVNPREPAALAEAIRILVADRFLRQAMGSAGRDQVESRFDRDSIQKLYVEELERQVRLSDPLFQ